MEDNSENAAETGKGGGTGGDCGAQNPNPNAGRPPIPAPSKPKSCKGCLLYSALGHSKSKNPTCIGIPGTHDKLAPLLLREAELEASRRGASHGGFIYSCLGYSFYFDDKSSSAESQNETPEMPYCNGLEFLGYHPATTTESKGHKHATPQPQGNSKPAHDRREAYLNRVRRNMSIVESGVAKNLKRVGNYAKETLDDILGSNRKGPK